MSIRLKLSLLLGLLFMASIGNTVFTFLLESYSEEKLNWVIHTHEVINESDKLLSSMTDAETGQRGFLLTGNKDYLEPYRKGELESKRHLEHLLKLTSDNLEQQKKLSSITESMKHKFEELELTIGLKKNRKGSQALDIVTKNDGKKYMDTIRILMAEFQNKERILLEQRKGNFRESRAQITTLVIIEILFLIFLALITVFFIKGSLFNPLQLLLDSTAKMERGEKNSIAALLPNDEMGYLLSRFYEMSEKVIKKTETLAYSASHDELTGLKNRAELYSEINDSILSLKKTNRKIAIIFIDLNKFKQLNDTLGHDAGDFILKETATRLEGSTRSEDVVFRQGGDEFIVMLKNIQDISHIEKIVSKIINQFEVPVMYQGNSIDILLSLGVAISPDDTVNADELVKFSDVAMYEAKKDKDNIYKFFDKSMLKRESDTSS